MKRCVTNRRSTALSALTFVSLTLALPSCVNSSAESKTWVSGMVPRSEIDSTFIYTCDTCHFARLYQRSSCRRNACTCKGKKCLRSLCSDSLWYSYHPWEETEAEYQRREQAYYQRYRKPGAPIKTREAGQLAEPESFAKQVADIVRRSNGNKEKASNKSEGKTDGFRLTYSDFYE